MSLNGARCQRGFTLIEVGVAMLIFSLLLVGALSTLRVQTERSRFAETEADLSEAKAAILAFAAVNGRLPCPAAPDKSGTADFGKESCSPARERGLVPWSTLGIQGLDAWGLYFSYQVPQAFTASGWTKSTATALGIYESASATEPTVDAKAVGFAVWSHGPNGHTAINSAGIQQGAAGTADEDSNTPTAPAPLKLVLRAHSDDFDDQGVWVSKFVIFKQLLDTGFDINAGSSSSSSSSGGG